MMKWTYAIRLRVAPMLFAIMVNAHVCQNTKETHTLSVGLNAYLALIVLKIKLVFEINALTHVIAEYVQRMQFVM